MEKIAIGVLYFLAFALPMAAFLHFLRVNRRERVAAAKAKSKRAENFELSGEFEDAEVWTKRFLDGMDDLPTEARAPLLLEIWLVGSGLFAGMVGGIWSLTL